MEQYMRYLTIFLMILAMLSLSAISTATASTSRSLTDQQIQRADQFFKFLTQVNPQAVAQHKEALFSGSVRHVSADGAGGISGRVDGLTEKEYVYAWVEAFTAKVQPDNADSTYYNKGISAVDSVGNYKIEGLPAGEYYVIAFAEGYELLYYNNVLDMIRATPVLVNENQLVEKIDFKMQKITPGTATISGSVFQAQDGVPVPNAYVNAYSPEIGYWSSAVTDQSGLYTLTGLKAANYFVQTWSEGYLEQYYNQKSNWSESDTIAVADSAKISGIDFRLVRAGSISGVVTDKEGRPLAMAYLYASPFGAMTGGDSVSAAQTYGKAMTDENGYYIIQGLASGDYAVQMDIWTRWNSVTLWYNQKLKPELADPVSVIVGNETARINFVTLTSAPEGVINGRVTDANAKAVADAFISVQSADPSMWVYASAMTDKEGYYSVVELPDGYYYVSAGVQNGWQYVSRWWPDAETFDGAQPIYVSESASVTADFTLPLVVGTSAISGRVTASDGHPLAWANINISPAKVDDPNGQVISPVWAWAYTDSGGYYAVKQLPAGEYKVYSSYWENMDFGEQWWDGQKSQETADIIRLAENEHKDDINFSLTVKPIYGSITGVVVDSLSGLPIARAYVKIAPNYDDNWSSNFRCFWRGMSAITDENGSFAIDWLYEGDYQVSVHANGSFEYFKNAPVIDLASPVKVIGGQKTYLRFALTPRQDGNGEITGRILMEGSQTPLDIAVVTAKPRVSMQVWPLSEMFYTAVTDSFGNFRLRGLPEGVEFYLYAFSNWGVGEYYNNVYDPEQATLVSADGVHPTIIEDIELPVYRWYWYDAENGGKNNAPSNAQVVGVVKDGEGNPIVGVRIVVYNESSQAVADAQTRKGGLYEIGGLPPGNYVLQAGGQGYQSAYNGNVTSLGMAQPINLGAGTLQIDFVLSTKTGVVSGNDHPALPQTMKLMGNYPNPFNPETRIVFALPKMQHVQLAVYNLAGERVATLISGSLEKGIHEVSWNGRDEAGRMVSSGLYLYRLESEIGQLTGKMLLMK